MPSESPQGPNTKCILTAWINHSERVISFHPVPGFLRFRNSKKAPRQGCFFAVQLSRS